MEEIFNLLFVCKPHHPLNPGAVIPGPVEQHDFTARRQIRHKALEIPLRLLTLRRRRQRSRPAHAGVEPLGDPLDRTAFASRIPALKQHNDLFLVVDDPVLQLDQLCLQRQQLMQVSSPL